MSANQTKVSKRNLYLLLFGIIVAILALTFMFLPRNESAKPEKTKAHNETKHQDDHEQGESSEVELSDEAQKAAGIEIVEVSQHPFAATLRFTGTIEANPQQTQQITPLIGGRVERVTVALGDHVRAGAVIAIISSPEVAEMHGKLHEAETRFELAEQNYQRVLRAENRSALIQAKARLDEAEATLRRTQKLIELGAGAGKDLIAAEAAYKTAKAEYDYQNNISLNREVQQAKAEVETSRVEVLHLRNSLRALGANVPKDESKKVEHNTSTLALVAPLSGTVTERLVNAGAGIEAGKPLFTISNISILWVIANVPESQASRLRPGVPATIRAAALGSQEITGRINYIDPLLNEETRTARVRIEIKNPAERLRIGTFVEVDFATGAIQDGKVISNELAIPEEAIQRIEERVVVFIPKADEAGHFEVREVEIGGIVEGYRQIISGLKIGERVVTKGSFTLKTQLLKSDMGGHAH
jgi:cobalt-zinc-cadmium efflux system membrane fusion protein